MTDSRDETAGAGSARANEPPAGAENEQPDAAGEIAELKDRLLRALAEMENLRRRTEREIADARAYGIAAFARDILGVADNMRRALDAAEGAQGEDPKASLNALIEGIELTDRELRKALEKQSVVKLEPYGQKFDPNFHQAMYELPDPSVPPGTVVQVMQTGYTIGDRVLRPALVGVAKGGQKTPSEPAAPGMDSSSVEGRAGGAA